MNPIRVTIPNGKVMESMHEGGLNIEALMTMVRHAHMLPRIATVTILSTMLENILTQGIKSFFESTKY